MGTGPFIPEFACELGIGWIDVDLRAFHPSRFRIVAAANLNTAVPCYIPIDLEAKPQDEVTIFLVCHS